MGSRLETYLQHVWIITGLEDFIKAHDVEKALKIFIKTSNLAKFIESDI